MLKRMTPGINLFSLTVFKKTKHRQMAIRLLRIQFKVKYHEMDRPKPSANPIMFKIVTSPKHFSPPILTHLSYLS